MEKKCPRCLMMIPEEDGVCPCCQYKFVTRPMVNKQTQKERITVTPEKKCRYCAMVIPKDANICPHCRKTTGWTLPVKIIVGLLVLSAFGTVMSRIDKPAPNQVRPVVAKQIEAMAITSEQLYDEYEANEIAADQKYKGKLLEVTGILSVIGKSVGDKPYLNLKTGKFTHQVMVVFPADVFNDKLATFKRGNQIQLTGICKGKTLGMVMISLR